MKKAKKGELWIGEWNSLEYELNLTSQRQRSPRFQQNMPSESITVLRRTIRLLIQQPKVSCHHRSSLFNYIIFFITQETNQGFSRVRNKSNFPVEGYRKAEWCKLKRLYWCPSDRLQCHTWEDKEFHHSRSGFWRQSVIFYAFCGASYLP